jgi:hypothetical protein
MHGPYLSEVFLWRSFSRHLFLILWLLGSLPNVFISWSSVSWTARSSQLFVPPHCSSFHHAYALLLCHTVSSIPTRAPKRLLMVFPARGCPGCALHHSSPSRCLPSTSMKPLGRHLPHPELARPRRDCAVVSSCG